VGREVSGEIVPPLLGAEELSPSFALEVTTKMLRVLVIRQQGIYKVLLRYARIFRG
jgi:hypothetical protein